MKDTDEMVKMEMIRWCKATGQITTLSLIVLLGGCTSVQEILPLPNEPQDAAQTEVREDARLEQLVTYFNLVVRMSAQEARREYEAQRRLLTPGVCNEPRLLVAMLLTNPSLKLPLEETAADLLQPCLENGSSGHDPALTYLAPIVYIMLEEKEKLHMANRRLVTARYRINLLKGQIETLNGKLDELKRIERSIQERE